MKCYPQGQYLPLLRYLQSTSHNPSSRRITISWEPAQWLANGQLTQTKLKTFHMIEVSKKFNFNLTPKFCLVPVSSKLHQIGQSLTAPTFIIETRSVGGRNVKLFSCWQSHFLSQIFLLGWVKSNFRSFSLMENHWEMSNVLPFLGDRNSFFCQKNFLDKDLKFSSCWNWNYRWLWWVHNGGYRCHWVHKLKDKEEQASSL